MFKLNFKLGCCWAVLELVYMASICPRNLPVYIQYQLQGPRKKAKIKVQVKAIEEGFLRTYSSDLNQGFKKGFKNLFSTMSFLFKNYSLVKIMYQLIRCYKTRYFL